MTEAALIDLDSLDKETLKALLIRERRSNAREIEHLKLVIEKYRWMLFGVKSEKLAGEPEHLDLRLEELETNEAAGEAAQEKRASAQPAGRLRRRPRRKPLPEDLPRAVVTHLPEHDCCPDSCPDCGGALRQFGEDISEQLERIPATFKVIRHVRVKMACTKCDVIVEAPAPSRPIERGLAGPNLLAHVLVSKYAVHLPLYSQSEIFAREGIELDRSTLADWVGAASHLLAPLVDQIRKQVLAADK
ncbi:MAG: transposase, partial [Terracidiphilus sp.]